MRADSDRVRKIFGEAIEISSQRHRQEFLEQACGGDESLRREVEDYLASHEVAGDFLESGAIRAQAPTLQSVAEQPGTVIGRYKLLQSIGEGGFGVVYMAEQKEPVRRKVALKIIKPGMDSCDVISRFEAERQALAMMDHPNIAKVLDAGTTDSSRPYFVMELVMGVPVTEYCDEHQLSPRERLQLFLPICQAVQHAHQKGIIHRDLKPSNVLVAEYDHQPMCKVIDFGIAKAVHQPLTEKTMFTQFGQILGTFAYMSPEQAKLNQLDIDTRSDVYSLGVLLYELLTGNTPFDRDRLRAAAMDEVLRIIREEEPLKPSTKVSRSNRSAPAAARCRTEPQKLSILLRRDLDWIVMKSLEKERSRRYETASALADDIKRFLVHQPVEASPPSRWYRLGKFMRRNRRGVAAGVLSALALVAGATGTTVGMWRATEFANELHDANRELEESNRAYASTNDELVSTKDNLQRSLLEEQRQRKAALRRGYTDAIVRALRDWEYGRTTRAHLGLWSCIPQPGQEDMRGFEWHLLWRECRLGWTQPRPTTFEQHEASVVSLDVSPDGAWMAFGHSDASVTLINSQTETREQIGLDRQAVWHQTPVVFSPAGGLLAYSSDTEGAVVLRDLTTGEESSLAGYGAPIIALSFSRDGRWLAAGGSHGRQGGTRPIWVWEVDTRKVHHTLAGHPAGVTTLAFSPDSRLLAAGANNGAVKLWKMSDGSETISPQDVELSALHAVGDRLAAVDAPKHADDRTSPQIDLFMRFDDGYVRALPSGHGRKVWDLDFSPDGTLLTWACGDWKVRLWRVGSEGPPVALAGHRDEARCVLFDPDMRFLVSAGRDNVIRIWDLATLSQKATLRGYHSAVFGLLWRPGEQHQLLGIGGGEVIQWDISRDLQQDVFVSPGWVSDVAISTQGRRLAAVSNGQVQIWDLSTGALISPSKQVKGRATCVDISPEFVVAIGYTSGEVALVDGVTGQWLHTWQRPPGHSIKDVFFDTEGKTLIAQDTSGLVSRWNCTTKELALQIDGCPGRMAYSANHDMLAYVGPGHVVTTVALDSGERAILGRHHNRIICMAFSPNGRRLASAGRDGAIKIWSLPSPENNPEMVFEFGGWPLGLLFAEDNNTLYSGHGDRTIKILDLNSGAERCVLERHQGSVQCLAISRDNQTLVSGSRDHTVRIWRAARPEEVEDRELQRVISGNVNGNQHSAIR